MSNPYDADVLDGAGNVRISGAVDFTDPDNQPGGGRVPATGAGSPVGVTAPSSGIGSLYIDTTNGALYIAAGVTSADWVVVGGVTAGNNGEAIGVFSDTGTLFVIAGVDNNTELDGTGARLTDAFSLWNGNGDGLRIVGNGTDGEQKLVWQNAAGSFQVVDENGTLNGGPGGVTFPSSDPNVNGAWWDNAGTLTRSTG